MNIIRLSCATLGIFYLSSALNAADESLFLRYNNHTYKADRFPDRVPEQKAKDDNEWGTVIRHRPLKFVENGFSTWIGSFTFGTTITTFRMELRNIEGSKYKGIMVQADPKDERGYEMVLVEATIAADKIENNAVVSSQVNLKLTYLTSGKGAEYAGTLDMGRWTLKEKFQVGEKYGVWAVKRVS